LSAEAGKIWLSVPHMSGRELDYVHSAFENNWLSSIGPNLEGFEADVAKRLGNGVHCLAVSSGTAALHLVLRCLGIESGDRVALTSMTFAASAFPITYQNGIPVFLDTDERSYTLDPGVVEDYLARASKAGTLPKVLIAVHLYGQHADVDPIAATCRKYGVVLVEDAAESLGATYRGRQTATSADYSILSFNGNKMITTSGGGMVVTRDPKAIARMKKWANQSREPAIEYLHREVGYNYRMSNVLAGIGRGQLEVLDQRVKARRAVAQRYADAIAAITGVWLSPELDWGTHSRWLSVIRWDPARVSATPAKLVDAFAAANIEARPVWRPMHTQPIFAGCEYHGRGRDEEGFATSLCLPSSSSLTAEEQGRIISTLRRALENSRRPD
jgi:pyridoxal phosphate-dependent aminotransferase EpsN